MASNPKGIFAFDLDGTLTERNDPEIANPAVRELIRQLNEIGYYPNKELGVFDKDKAPLEVIRGIKREGRPEGVHGELDRPR